MSQKMIDFCQMSSYNNSMQEEEKIEVENLIYESQEALKDIFVAQIRKRGVELDIEFLNGQWFTLTLFENAQKNNCKRLHF